MELFLCRLSQLSSAINIMGVIKQISEYLFLRKKDPNRPKSKWIGYMHGINRLSLIIFIICLIILAIKLLS
ncbi:MAG: DUF6728 family protein [Chitinophagaceae bacterium]